MRIDTKWVMTTEEKIKRTPVQRGHWTGERGNSRLYSDNPRMRELGAEYIEYVNGEGIYLTDCFDRPTYKSSYRLRSSCRQSALPFGDFAARSKSRLKPCIALKI